MTLLKECLNCSEFRWSGEYYRQVRGLAMGQRQVEAWESYKPSKVKDKAQRAVAMLHADGTLAAEEDMLRLYRILAKYSRKLGATKVYEKLDEQGRFICSLKFHLMWAEAYAQSGDLDQFTHVLNLARSRLAEVPLVELEMGFRELADQYFPNADIFNEDETVAALNVGQISDLAEKKKSRTKLRLELVDRPEDKYVAPSIEELRAAMVADQQMANGDDFLVVPMDITMAHPELSTAPSQQCIRKEREQSRLSRIVGRILETVEEFDSDILKEGKETGADATATPAQVRKEAFVNAKRSEDCGKKEPKLTADEVTLSGAKFSTLGIDKKLDSGIVTSTPARGTAQPPTHAEFFAPLNHEIEEELRRMQDEEALSRRSSLASSQAGLNLSDTQGSRQESDRGDCEKDVNRDEIQTATGTINPWDRELQREILKRADNSSITHYIDLNQK
ncbi:unnamed protein product [Heligmosomoides polygyrus]|uniref:BUB1 N-terminal domain-containing protein n=1 Tax=Heligmosomoides polygyrus TaxID=6339 RepID=A0A3P8BCC2_HELPZ|nr:unnamed protein product [Heligmosomoides polygyrus]